MELPDFHYFGQINWVDIVILFVMGRGAYVCYPRGATWGVFRLIGALLIAIIAFSQSYPLAQWIQTEFSIESPFLEWVFFILICVVLGTLVMFAIDSVARMMWLSPRGWYGKVSGSVLGGLQGMVLASLVLAMLVLSTSSYMEVSVKERSLIGARVLSITPTVFKAVRKWVPGGGRPSRTAWARVSETYGTYSRPAD